MNNKMIKKLSIICVFVFSIMICMYFCLTVNSKSVMAAEINSLANKTISVRNYIDETGSKVVQVKGLQAFKNEIDHYRISKKDKAKYIYKIIGEDDYTISSFSNEQLMEALNFEESTRKENYIYSGDTGQTYLTKEDLIQNLTNNFDRITDEGIEFLIKNNIDTTNISRNNVEQTIEPMSSTTTTSNDGYIKLVTTSTKTTGSVSGRTYYLISAKASWLLVPYYLRQDVLAISSDATYDNTYNNYGYFYEKCDEYVGSESSGNLYASHVINNNIYKNTGSNNPNDIMFEYASGIAGIGLRFNMYEGTYVGDAHHEFVYRSITAYLRYRVSLYNADGGVQAGYAHKQFTLWGDITLNLLPLGIEFGLSGIGSIAKYYGETLSIYY